MEWAKADRVGGDTCIENAVHLALNGERPLTFNMKVAVNARGDPSALESLDARAGALMLVEWRKMPEHKERLSRLPERDRGGQGSVQRAEFSIERVPPLKIESVGRNRCASSSADDDAMRGDRIATDRHLRLSEHWPNLRGGVPPAVMIARGNYLGTW